MGSLDIKRGAGVIVFKLDLNKYKGTENSNTHVRDLT